MQDQTCQRASADGQIAKSTGCSPAWLNAPRSGVEAICHQAPSISGTSGTVDTSPRGAASRASEARASAVLPASGRPRSASTPDMYESVATSGTEVSAWLSGAPGAPLAGESLAHAARSTLATAASKHVGACTLEIETRLIRRAN